MRIGEMTGLGEETIKKACSMSMKAHLKYPSKPYLHDKVRGGRSNDVVFAFSGSWSLPQSGCKLPFGDVKVNANRFPSLRSVGVDEVAKVNEAFAAGFEQLLTKSSLSTEVAKAVSDKKQIVFAGHSSGGPMAILAALWFFEVYIRREICSTSPFCVTFGSPLIGNFIFSHALKREKWANNFIHFVTRYDIVPRLMLAPLSLVEQGTQAILPLINPNHKPVTGFNSLNFFGSVMRSASCVASHAACNLMGCTNLLLENLSAFIDLSPYRPFGTYVFCSGNGKLVVVENPDAVLQLLFYCAQLNSTSEANAIAEKSLKDHLTYENELQASLEMQDVIHLSLDNLINVPLSSNARVSGESATINSALNDLGLSARGRLCLRAAGEQEKQRLENQRKIDSNKRSITEGLKKIQEYKTLCEVRKVGYYDAFKVQKDINDFHANVTRLELAGIWDEIIEMLKRYELPEEFEGRREWIELGTSFRRLVEPLDIANYYRHLKNEDTGKYMDRARPKRYRFTQRWREHAERMAAEPISESCFWAEIEELKSKEFGKFKDEIMNIENLASDWAQKGLLGKDVFMEETTFDKWWRRLPEDHREKSLLSRFLQVINLN